MSRSSRPPRRPRLAAAVLAAGMAITPTGARAQDAIVAAGFNVRFTSGSFGSDRTTRLVYAPAVLQVDVARFELAGYFPYLTIDDGTVAPSQGGFVPMRGSLTRAPDAGMPMGGHSGAGGTEGSGMAGGPEFSPRTPGTATPDAVLTNQSGLGDIVASMGYRVVDDALSGLQVVVTGRLKVPTATASRGLGTGRTDVAFAGTLRKRFRTGWIYGEGGYLFVGDPAGVDLSNAALWTVGGGVRIAGRLLVLGSAYGNGALLREFAAPVELGAGIGIRLREGLTLTILPAVGLSDASPKYAVTVGLTSDVLRR